MKNLIKNESAVAYVLLFMGLAIIVTGIFFSFISDGVDAIIGAINGYAGTPLQGAMDANSIETGDMLLMVFKLALLPSLVVIIYWAFNYATKPVKPF